MSKEMLTKVMKYTLRYIGGCGDFYEMQHIFWDLQKQTRAVLNKSIQIAFEWDYRNRESYRKTGEYLDVYSVTGYKRLDGYIYDRLKNEHPDLTGGNLNAAVQTAWKKYNSSKNDVRLGNMSLPSYRRDQPLIFHKPNVRISKEKYGVPAIEFTVLSNKYKKEHGLSSNPAFEVLLQDGTQRSIFDRVLRGEYKLGQCMVQYEKK